MPGSVVLPRGGRGRWPLCGCGRRRRRHIPCILHSRLVARAGNVNMMLPNCWLWNMVDEFLYQFQSFAQYRTQLSSKSPGEIELLKECDKVRRLLRVQCSGGPTLSVAWGAALLSPTPCLPRADVVTVGPSLLGVPSGTRTLLPLCCVSPAAACRCGTFWTFSTCSRHL